MGNISNESANDDEFLSTGEPSEDCTSLPSVESAIVYNPAYALLTITIISHSCCDVGHMSKSQTQEPLRKRFLLGNPSSALCSAVGLHLWRSPGIEKIMPYPA